MSPDISVGVRNGNVTVDPRGCGNAAICINHSCSSNSELFEMNIGGKTIVVIKALKAIAAVE